MPPAPARLSIRKRFARISPGRMDDRYHASGERKTPSIGGSAIGVDIDPVSPHPPVYLRAVLAVDPPHSGDVAAALGEQPLELLLGRSLVDGSLRQGRPAALLLLGPRRVGCALERRLAPDPVGLHPLPD